jgi:hypothetical protein
MKRLLSIAAVTVALVSLSSCKKDYVCSFDSSLIGDIQYTDLDKDQAETTKNACEAAGGNWSVD